VQTLVQPIEKAGAQDYVRPKPRDIQFRGENCRRHEPPTSLSFPSNDFPDRFFHGPSLGGHGGTSFALVVRRKSASLLQKRHMERSNGQSV